MKRNKIQRRGLGTDSIKGEIQSVSQVLRKKNKGGGEKGGG